LPDSTGGLLRKYFEHVPRATFRRFSSYLLRVARWEMSKQARREHRIHKREDQVRRPGVLLTGLTEEQLDKAVPWLLMRLPEKSGVALLDHLLSPRLPAARPRTSAERQALHAVKDEIRRLSVNGELGDALI